MATVKATRLARAAALALHLFASTSCGATSPPAPVSRCAPSQPCWPAPAEWQRLAARLTGRLERPQSPFAPCQRDVSSAACAAAQRVLASPYAIQDDPGGTQSAGWLGAWQSAPSPYAVVATSPGDVVAAVNFAREHRLRLVIKGTGHDYLGRSTAPDALLVWTHEMRRVTTHDAFVPRGCPAGQAGVPAVSVEAGTRWLEAYQEVTVRHGRYVQGGGCTSVGAAGGFPQGGGFGSWSKRYGTAAGNVLEAEVVTAGGALVTASACQNQDLFWALRGGGGGTFGVVTRMTMRTHSLPSHFGFVFGSIEATSDGAFQELLERFIAFYRQSLANPSWGEQVSVGGDNSLRLSMSFLDMTGEEAEKVWQPLRAWIDQHPDRFTMKTQFLVIPANRMWDRAFFEENFAAAIRPDDRSGVKSDLFWWASNQEEVSTTWYTYQSRWIPLDRFEGAAARRTAVALFQASRHRSLDLHFNKGLAGASADAIRRNRDTSMNPAVERAAALVIVAANGPGQPGVRGREPDAAAGQAQIARIGAAMKIIRDATPGAGTYVNETDYFEPDWQRAFWGENYARLLAIKRKVDPAGLFWCHHCVGSEARGEDSPPASPRRDAPLRREGEVEGRAAPL
jgi:FAD/FMN-containing dehydrogenase